MALSELSRRLAGVVQTAIAAVLAVVILALLAGTVPSVFGYEPFVVYGGSMEPAIQMGDLAVVGPVSPDQLSVGDVITYRDPANLGTIITHRITGVSQDERGNLSFQTKGDANQSVDTISVTKGGVLGRVVYTVPKVGFIVDFSKQPLGKLLLLVVPGLLLAIDYLFNRVRPGILQPAPRTSSIS